MRVAICDHHALVRDALRQMLEQCAGPVEIVEASSWGQSLETLAAGGADLVVVEPAMPGMEPLDGIAALCQATPARIVVLSAIEERAAIGNLLAGGVAGYIPKRLGIQAVQAALRLILSGERFIPASMLEARGPGSKDGGETTLTAREAEILALLRKGHSNKAIARHLDITEVTVKSHLGSLFRKLGVHNRVQAALYAS